jgi:ParB-like chromosome segregation protein Spo0J
VTHGIVPALVDLAVEVDSLEPHPDNPNVGDVDAITVQMKAHGQHTPIVVQESTRRIVAGNHRWQAAKALGWTHLAAILVPWDDLEVLEVLVGDNLPGRRARDNEDQLAAILGHLAEGGTLGRAGYTTTDLVDLLRRINVPDLEDLAAEHGEPNPREFWPAVRVECRHETYRAWTTLVRQKGATEDQVFADLIVRAGEAR